MTDATAHRTDAAATPDPTQLVELLRTLADAVPALVAYVNRDRRLVYANRGFERWVGRSRGSLFGMDVRDVLGEPSFDALSAEIDRALGGEMAAFEMWLPVPSGEQRFVAATFIPDIGASGRTRGFFAVALDETERRRAEEVSRQEIDRIARLAQAAPVISFTADADGRVSYAGAAWREFFGRDPRTPVEWINSELVHPDDRASVARAWCDASQRLESFEFEFRGCRHDGQYRWLLCRCVPVLHDTGELDQWVAVMLDIHGRKELEAERERAVQELAHSLIEMRRSRALLDTIINLAPVGIDFFDREHRFVQVNEAAAEINGVPAQAHIGRRVDEVLPNLEEQVAIFDRVIQTGEVIRDVEVTGETPAAPGVKRWWLASYYPVPDPDGSIQGTGVIFREITEKKRHEAERERLLAEARAANEAKDEFLGLISHELKTPITTIRGNAEILARHRKRLDDDALESALRDIDEASERLTDIIDSLLLLARIERGVVPESEPVLICRLVNRVAEEHMRRYRHRRVIVRSDGYAGPVDGSALYLEQILVNLLSNAEKYSGPHEPIEVEIKRTADEVCVTVLDRGPGINEAEVERLFEPFYRGKDILVQAPGVGVGLAVCRRLMEAQGGSMWAAARPGGGSEFSFCLPVSQYDDLDT